MNRLISAVIANFMDILQIWAFVGIWTWSFIEFVAWIKLSISIRPGMPLYFKIPVSWVTITNFVPKMLELDSS
jgi:hypothetical protein